jgi:hypothetical protein
LTLGVNKLSSNPQALNSFKQGASDHVQSVGDFMKQTRVLNKPKCSWKTTRLRSTKPRAQMFCACPPKPIIYHLWSLDCNYHATTLLFTGILDPVKKCQYIFGLEVPKPFEYDILLGLVHLARKVDLPYSKMMARIWTLVFELGASIVKWTKKMLRYTEAMIFLVKRL